MNDIDDVWAIINKDGLVQNGRIYSSERRANEDLDLLIAAHGGEDNSDFSVQVFEFYLDPRDATS